MTLFLGDNTQVDRSLIHSLHLKLVEVIQDPENSHRKLPKAIVPPRKLKPLSCSPEEGTEKKSSLLTMSLLRFRSESFRNTELYVKVFCAFVGYPTLSTDSEEIQEFCKRRVTDGFTFFILIFKSNFRFQNRFGGKF